MQDREKANGTHWGVIDDNGTRIYEGFLAGVCPRGSGTLFYPNGFVYQEGVFGAKGLLCGKEYFPDGKLRFEGVYEYNNGYGPNYPICGKVYDQSGAMIYEGKLVVWRGGLGYPFVKEPKGFGPVPQEKRPKI